VKKAQQQFYKSRKANGMKDMNGQVDGGGATAVMQQQRGKRQSNRGKFLPADKKKKATRNQSG